MIIMERAIGFLYQTERRQTHGETEIERRESASVARRRREGSVYIKKILGRHTFESHMLVGFFD